VAKSKGPKQPHMGNVQQMLKQVQDMQVQMEQAQAQLAHETVETSSGGGMVKVVVTGDLVLKSVHIDPQAVDPEDVDMLADMVLAAVNEALRAAQELANSRLGATTSGIDLGGLGGLGLPGL
jgi:nucleoid-associated protein EbfC